jgi:cell division protein ZapA
LRSGILKECFHIRILGQELSVLSDSGEEHVAAVVKYVSDKVEEIEKSSNKYNTLSVAILTALNIADQLISLKKVEEYNYSQLENRSERLISLINDIR